MPPPDKPTLVHDLEYRPLSRDRRREVFSCGERDIDKWFNGRSPWRSHASFESRVTTVHPRGNPAVCAFYSLRMITEDEALLGTSSLLRVRSPSGAFPAMQLEWLAVHRARQKTGIGTVVMGRVLDVFIQAIDTIGVPALTCRAINRDVAKFYQGLGFAEYGVANDLMPRMLLGAQTALELKRIQQEVAAEEKMPPEAEASTADASV